MTADITVDLRVRKAARELAEAIQRELNKNRRFGEVPAGGKDPLFTRPPGISDIVEKALAEFREKYRL